MANPSETGLSWNQSYTYDSMNRLKTAAETDSASAATWSQTYVFDRHGNRAVLAGGFVPAPATPVVSQDTEGAVAAIYPARNQLNAGVGYDLAGNVLSESATSQTYAYDAENRVSAATVPNTPPVTYEYDPGGRRVRRLVGSSVTVFVYDAAGDLAAEYGGRSATQAFLLTDPLGSVRATVDAGGYVARCFDYLPFGEELRNGQAGRNSCYPLQAFPAVSDGLSVRFTGKERDAETGLDYFGARYFSGAQGRFTSPDPLDWLSWQSGNEDDQQRFQAFIADPQSFNKYVYARNNPLKYIDPTGEDFELAVTFKGDVSEEEKARILTAIRQYLSKLDIGRVVVRDAAVKSDDKRTWGQWVKDAFSKDFQAITVDLGRASYKDATEYIFAGDMTVSRA